VTVECPTYADHEIGAAVRMALEGMSYLDIATELDISPKEVLAMLTKIEKVKAEHVPNQKKVRRNPGGRGRPSCLTNIEREQAIRWRKNGISVPVIAKRLTCGQGAVRWVTEYETEDKA
jgi:predicted ArsR family transcriptional regulator